MSTGADLVVKGGLLVDGSGAPGREADVAITGDRITDIGPDLSADRVVDASGHVVAPGFVDIHTHYDAQVFWDPALTPSCFHGVTTVFAGNCGFSIAPVRPEHHELVARTLENVEDMNLTALMDGVPWDFETFAEYLESVRARRPALNFGAFVGHSAVRMAVLGDDAYERSATPEEVDAMREVVRDALAAGAVGFSSSYVPVHMGAHGKPVPSRYGDAAEFEALAAVLAEEGRGVIEITGSPYPDGLYDFQRRNGRPVTTPLLAGRGTQDALALHARELAAGTGLWPQVTPRPLVMGLTATQPYLLSSIAPIGELVGQPDDARARAYADPAWRQSVRDALQASKPLFSWRAVTITSSPTHPELIGRPLAELAAELGVLPVDVLLDAAVDDDLATRFQVVLGNSDPAGVEALLTADGVTLGLSDAGAHVSQLCDAPQATDLLGNWVRDRGVMSVEHAVRMLSGLPADIFGLADRGYLRRGGFADVTVFDAATVAPGPIRTASDLPGGADRLTADQPAGVSYVIVNGTCVVDHGELAVGHGSGTVLDAASFRTSAT